MPELPEVETIRRQLEPALSGRSVVASGSHPSPRFVDAVLLDGAHIVSLRRRGKYLIADTTRAGGGRAELVVHLGMTGSLRAHPLGPVTGIHGIADPTATDPYVRAWWDLDDRTRLVFRDVRRFGRIALVDPGEYDSLPTLAAMGPDVFDDAFTPECLAAAMRSSRRHVKTMLLSQRAVAGVGNIYADEALWRVGVNPRDRVLSRARSAALRDAVRAVMTESIERGGTTLRDYVDANGRSGDNVGNLRCYGRGGKPCHRCGTPLARGVLDGRTTTWCAACQPRRR
ncbi:MAG: bifunctional DNA-formamidopyrimidine glycosylase/DNA-(apurinic or apyrimidinic site) lyase [Microthrixaceae bacterium]